MIKIIIADDHQIFIDGLKALLSEIEDFEIIKEAPNGKVLLEILEDQLPDVILLDMNMPKIDGLEATKIISEKYPSIKILMLTMFGTVDYIQKLIKAGAQGYLLKNTGKAELELAIRSLVKGENYYSQEVSNRIMEGLQKRQKQDKDYQIVELTDREKEVLILIAEELTTNEIADKLFISKHTVETHRKNLISKLNVRNVNGLVKYAFQQGLVD
tara:strand:- start:26702 stop:27343 length:642 start_codon:yes stop_codon:yes gene_type:complete